MYHTERYTVFYKPLGCCSSATKVCTTNISCIPLLSLSSMYLFNIEDVQRFKTVRLSTMSGLLSRFKKNTSHIK